MTYNLPTAFPDYLEQRAKMLFEHGFSMEFIRGFIQGWHNIFGASFFNGPDCLRNGHSLGSRERQAFEVDENFDCGEAVEQDINHFVDALVGIASS